MAYYLFNQDITRLMPVQFEHLLKSKVKPGRRVSFILYQYFTLLQEGWSPRYASKLLFINSKQIDLMEKVRKNKDYIEISRDIGLMNMNPKNPSFMSLPTDNKIRKVKKNV